MTSPPPTTDALRFLAGLTATTATTFARIVVGLFPPWFDFAPDKFAILGNADRLRLFIADAHDLRSDDHAWISTSDSRNMFCEVVRRNHVHRGVMSMHYMPSAEHLERARRTLAFALHALFPTRPTALGAEAVAALPAGAVFPPER